MPDGCGQLSTFTQNKTTEEGGFNPPSSAPFIKKMIPQTYLTFWRVEYLHKPFLYYIGVDNHVSLLCTFNNTLLLVTFKRYSAWATRKMWVYWGEKSLGNLHILKLYHWNNKQASFGLVYVNGIKVNHIVL